MLLSYLKLSLRLLARNPFFTFINVLGLSVGFASFFILWQYASTELKSDQYHKDFERMARIGVYWRWTVDNIRWDLNTLGILKPDQLPMMAADFSQVKSYVRILQQQDFQEWVLGHNNHVLISPEGSKPEILFEESRMVYADPNLFEFFTIPLVSGSKEKGLENARSIFLSQTTARKYFGGIDPIGKLLTVNDTIVMTVTGVFQDLPHNTHLAFDLVASNVGLQNRLYENRPPVLSYVKLNENTDPNDFAKMINKKVSKYWAFELNKYPSVQIELFVQPLKDIPFSKPFEYDYLKGKSKSTLILFLAVSVLILLMALINYLNLTISRMMKRMKEVATRKMTGALSSDFSRQFLIESFIVNVSAVALAFTAMQLVRQPLWLFLEIYIPEFNSITPEAWLLFGGVILTGIFISALYPTLIAASYNPRSLITFSKSGSKRKWLQSLLTISQYASAMTLILWSFVAYLQLNYILHKDLGFKREQIAIIESPVIRSSSYATDFDYFLSELHAVRGVTGATASLSVIGDTKMWLFSISPLHETKSIGMSTNGGVDENFIPFYGIKIIAGRNFLSTDKDNVAIMSRYGTERLGYKNPDDALGDSIFSNYGNKSIKIVGIIEDYRFKSLVNPGGANSEAETGHGVCLVYKDHLVPWFNPDRISVKVNFTEWDKTITEIKKRYDTIFPGNVFNWYFLDDHINKAYHNDKIARNQIALFTFLAIGISCLGLLAMMMTLTEEKTKEIGIRKVLGAGIKEIGAELLLSVFWQFIVSIVVALPVSYYLTNQYLDHYLERIHLNWWHFALPVVILVMIMFLTIASVLWKTAKSNPVEALKYE